MDIKNKILKTYLNLYKKLNNVRMVDLKESGVTKDSIAYYFGSLSKLDEVARSEFPNKFKDVRIDNLLNPKFKNKLSDALLKYKRFIITTAVTGQKVDLRALKAVKTYCNKNKAKLLVLVCSDPSHNSAQKGGYGTIDIALKDEIILTKDTELNSNLFISTVKTSAKQINPITGLSRIGQKEGSFIYASPKQMLKIASTSNVKMPRAIMTTGAITSSNYDTHRYMSERLAYLANNDHKMGGIIVEIEDDKIFHYRQIQFDNRGCFADLGYLYSGKDIKKYSPNAIILGDWHSGDTDPQVKEIVFKILRKYKPFRIVVHDGFNGMSVNPHETNNGILKYKRSEKNQLNLVQEIKSFTKDINAFTKEVQEVVIVKSNHDVFLDRYLSDCDFKKINSENLEISLELALAMIRGNDPLKYASEKFDLKDPLKIKWLKRDEDFKIAGIQCGSHGDQGPNGSRGTLSNMECSYNKCVTGHTHTPGIIREAYSVGTSSLLRLYNEGPSSWLHTHCFIYPNGMRQLINTINGKYTTL